MKKIEKNKPISIKDLPKDNFIEEESSENISTEERKADEKKSKQS